MGWFPPTVLFKLLIKRKRRTIPTWYGTQLVTNRPNKNYTSDGNLSKIFPTSYHWSSGCCRISAQLKMLWNKFLSLSLTMMQNYYRPCGLYTDFYRFYGCNLLLLRLYRHKSFKIIAYTIVKMLNLQLWISLNFSIYWSSQQ